MEKKTDQKKGGVKFGDPGLNKASIGVGTSRTIDEKPRVVLSPEECKETVIKIFN